MNEFKIPSVPDYHDRRAKINEFNKQNRWRKRGIGASVMTFPTLYVASFSAYIAIYHGDGTVAVSHGGTEIGQGINTKVAQVVFKFFITIFVEVNLTLSSML